jgi:hypothetical protein
MRFCSVHAVFKIPQIETNLVDLTQMDYGGLLLWINHCLHEIIHHAYVEYMDFFTSVERNENHTHRKMRSMYGLLFLCHFSLP